MLSEKRGDGDDSAAGDQSGRALLTDLQLSALARLENFGWRLKFVRQPKRAPPVVVVENTYGINFGILDANGSVIFNPPISLRDAH